MKVSCFVGLSILSLGSSLLACEKYSGTAGAVDPCCHGLAYLYPFGAEYGDQTTTICDGTFPMELLLLLGAYAYITAQFTADCSDLIYFPPGKPFLFFDRSWSSVYLGSNGLFSFGASDTAFISQAFPIQGSPLIAPLYVLQWG